MEPDPYIQFLENWIPGIGEDTELHDELHCHFNLGFSVNAVSYTHLTLPTTSRV